MDSVHWQFPRILVIEIDSLQFRCNHRSHPLHVRLNRFDSEQTISHQHIIQNVNDFNLFRELLIFGDVTNAVNGEDLRSAQKQLLIFILETAPIISVKEWESNILSADR